VWAARDEQRYRLRLVGEGEYAIESVADGSVLDVAGGDTRDGAAVVFWGANGGANQTWQLAPRAPGLYALVAQHSGKLLDVAGAATSDGARVLQWSDNGGQNQLWSIE
jgi:mannan endo-1,4-beta-mannosidase